MNSYVSVIVPIKDEVENLAPLVQELDAALAHLRHEVLLVDDGSSDGSRDAIRNLSLRCPHVRGILLDRNHGQTAAILAGFSRARGEILVTIDADRQNDPHDIPTLLEALKGHDMAIGIRTKRHDTWVRRAASRVANAVRSRVTGDGVPDTGCSLKAYRAHVVRIIPPFRGMHRFLPALARLHGHRIAQVPVSHRPRLAGTSKYGVFDRLLPASADLLAVRWMSRRLITYRVVEEVEAFPIATPTPEEVHA